MNRSYPLILSDDCGIACSIQGDVTLPRFTPGGAGFFKRTAMEGEALARRVDAHQRARIFRDARARIVARGVGRFGHLDAYLLVAAHRQEALGNGEPDLRHAFAPHPCPTVLVAGEFADDATR